MNETLSEALLLGCYTYAGLPFNVVRLRLQTQSHQGAYRGVRDAFVRIAKEEGIRALSKGGTPSLAGTILSNKLTNVVGGSTKKAVSMLELQKVDDEDELTLQKALEHSAMAFIASTATTVPENIASKLQLQRGPLGHGVYHGPLDCMAQVLKRELLACFVDTRRCCCAMYPCSPSLSGCIMPLDIQETRTLLRRPCSQHHSPWPPALQCCILLMWSGLICKRPVR
ncbi:hypothetical protein F444_17151 [Phytophthora nicotianae P1976]|uniref:Uncharacterized protein n=1 Tax=Phytophthora nicotianae P1976 TaxID=1317066 RepID=A0A080ZFY4_PHYNI|nr:hypothetical protein F444_17151 [Phytophthora nicotianae P1976]